MLLGRFKTSQNSSASHLLLATALVGSVAGAACKQADPKHDETARANRVGGGAPAAPSPGTTAAAAGGGEPTSDEEPADPSYQFMAQHPTPGPAGAPASARFVVHPGAGYKMNKEFPTKLTLEPPAGIVMEKTTFQLADAESFSEKELTFAVQLTAQQPGEFTIPATLRFAVCTPATCDPKKKKVALVMRAE